MRAAMALRILLNCVNLLQGVISTHAEFLSGARVERASQVGHTLLLPFFRGAVPEVQR
jgi:hypothetical protein